MALATKPNKAAPTLVGLDFDAFDWKAERTATRMVTPQEATHLLEARNNINRPLVKGQSEELAELIRLDKFRFNGDSVRFDWDGNLLDGQHRLWAIVLAGKPCKLLLVFGLDPEVFDTIDIGRRRSAADTIARLGVDRHRMEIASAIQWSIRWRRGDFDRNDKIQKVANTDVKVFHRNHPDIEAAVEQAYAGRMVMPVGILSALVYEIAKRDAELADRLVKTLVEPAGAASTDPFFQLRDYALHMRYDGKQKPIATFARAIKAANAAAHNRRIKSLIWRRAGRGAEPFPKLDF